MSATSRFAVHFFNWYWAGDAASAMHFKSTAWTHEPDWSALELVQADVGQTAAYYYNQFSRIRHLGFDAVMWEWHQPWPKTAGLIDPPPWPWHGANPPPEAVEAARATDLKIGMFYDMEIRFRGFPEFIQPTPPMVECMVNDIMWFYQSVPSELWLRDRHQNVPIVVYGYQFANAGNEADWHAFYRSLLAGIEQRLEGPPALHWTDAGKPVQTYAYQHFPQIHPFAFNPTHTQCGWGADSVTVLLGYDDYGVWQGNTQAPGSREYNLIIDDPRLVEEATALAETTDPSLVFFYGWNELFEGEAILPDLVHGDSRMALAQDVIHYLRGAKALSSSVRPWVICDDILEMAKNKPVAAERALSVLQRLRVALPEAEYHVDWPAISEGARLIIYLGDEVAPLLSRPESVLWIPSGLPTGVLLPPGVEVAITWETALAALARLGWKMSANGVLFTPRWTRVSQRESTVSEFAQPTRLPSTTIPGKRWVAVAPKAVPEHRHRLPSGWHHCTIHWLRGEPRDLRIENGTVILRYPEVVEFQPGEHAWSSPEASQIATISDQQVRGT